MTNQDVVFEMLGSLVTGAFDTARLYWRDDAVWHSNGQAATDPFAGDYDPDEYMAMGTRFATTYPDYQAEIVEVFELPPEVVAVRLKSWASGKDGLEIDGSGALMIYRVVNGKIVEGWGIGARHDRPA